MRCLIMCMMLFSGVAFAQRPATEWDKKLIVIANKAGIPAPLLAAVCYTESTHQPHATNLDDNGSSSIGLCQVKLATAKMMGYTGTVEGLYDGKANARLAARYLKYQLDRYPGGEWTDAIAAYNAGSVRKCNMEKKYFIITATNSKGESYKKKKPCVEGEHINQGYIEKVLSNVLP